MNYKKVLLSMLLIAGLSIACYAQSDTSRLLNIVSRLDTLTSTHPVEKVYLHTDRPYYVPGDTIWFKAYLTITDKHQLSALSGVLYADLIDKQSKIIRSMRLRVLGGTAKGDIALADSLPDGVYRLRAYTNWMRSNPPEYFFERSITIAGPRAGQVELHSTFKEITADNTTARHALLNYTDKFGRPFSGREVKYEIVQNGKSGATKTIMTDRSGNVDIILPPITGTSASNSELTTRIKLYGQIVANKNVKITQSAKNDVQFFPESGNQVIGVRSKTAFKAIGADGNGVHVKGKIVDNDGTEIAYFESQHLGMGVFAMTPQTGKTYRAKITYDDGSEDTFTLPMATQSGFVLAVNNSDSARLTLRVIANSEFFEQKKNTTFFIVGQMGGKVCYSTFGKLDNPVFTSSILKSRFATGIIQFTLFSAAAEPLCERIAFIQNDDQLKLNLQADKAIFASREQVKMNISVTNHDNLPVSGSFSVAVMSESRVPVNENVETGINTYLLLTSDLKGYIEQPGYYFNQHNDKTRADLDVLMLSQGYRRFEWKELLAGRYPVTSFQPEQSLSLSGTIMLPSGKPVVNGPVRILASKSNILIDTVTNTDGRFSFPDLDFPDSTKLVLMARKPNEGKNVNLVITQNPSAKVYPKNNTASVMDNAFAGAITHDARPGLEIADTSASRIAGVNKLKEVNIKARRPQTAEEEKLYGTSLIYKIKMSTLADYLTLADGIKWRVPGIRKMGDSLSYEGHNLTLVVDGLPMENQDILLFINPVDVQDATIKESSNTLYITTKASAGTDIVKLKDVNITATRSKRPQASPLSANLNGPGNADQIISSKNLENAGRLVDYLSTHIFGITYNSTTGEFRLTRSTSINPQPIAIILDGAQVSGDAISTMEADEVASVEFLKSIGYLAIYGSNASGGALIITTKRGNDADDSYKFESVPGNIYLNFNGFYKARQFYSPKYVSTQANSGTPDLRKTIYWNPNVITGKDGKANVDFYNSDGKGVYRAVIEGIDVNGNIGHYVYRYKVE
jgi:hypothetical protein